MDLRVQTAEELPFEDGRFDCVVSTWTLCSIQDARRALSEIRSGAQVRRTGFCSWSTGWVTTPESSDGSTA